MNSEHLTTKELLTQLHPILTCHSLDDKQLINNQLTYAQTNHSETRNYTLFVYSNGDDSIKVSSELELGRW